MNKQEILKDFTLTGVKSMPGREGNQLMCNLLYKGKKVAEFFDDASGGEPTLDFVNSEVKDEIYKVALDREVAEFMLKNGWAFMEAPHKIEFRTRVGWIIDELFNEMQHKKQAERNKKRLLKDCEVAVCYGVPDSGEYTYQKFKVPLTEVVKTERGKKMLQDLVDTVKRTKLGGGKKILNTNLESLGITV